MERAIFEQADELVDEIAERLAEHLQGENFEGVRQLLAELSRTLGADCHELQWVTIQGCCLESGPDLARQQYRLQRFDLA